MSRARYASLTPMKHLDITTDRRFLGMILASLPAATSTPISEPTTESSVVCSSGLARR